MYLDTSVVIKILLNEPDSPQWRARVLSGAHHQTSSLSVVEVRSALRQKRLLGALPIARAQPLWQRFQQNIQDGQLTLLPLTPAVLEEAGRLLEALPDSVPLRSLDAIHLATVRVFGLAPLATNDARMAAAARTLGLQLI